MNNIGNKLSSVSNLVESTGENVMNSVNNVANSVKTTIVGEPAPINFIKVWLLVAFGCFLLFNIYTYYMYKIDAFRYIYSQYKGSEVDPIGEVTRPVTKGIKKTVKLAEESAKALVKGSEMNSPEKTVEKPLVEEEEVEEEEPLPDSYMSSEIQAPRKQGWCYIGADKGFRSCVEIGKDDICMSGKVYNREDICKHPELRE